MLSSIHPLGERGKNNRFAFTATMFVVGSVVGGTITGVVVAAAGVGVDSLASSTAAVALASALIAAATIAEWRGLPLPCLRRQVDEDWLTSYRSWVYGAGYGFQLGAGVLTYITSAGIYAAVGCALLAGHPAASIAIMATFGLTRGLSIVPARSITDPARLQSFHRRLQATAPTAQKASVAALAAVAVAIPFFGL